MRPSLAAVGARWRDIRVENETKRTLQLILETMQEQQSRYPVAGLAERIDRMTQEVHRPESFTIEHHLLSILEIMRNQQRRYPTTGLADRIERIIRAATKPEPFAE